MTLSFADATVCHDTKDCPVRGDPVAAPGVGVFLNMAARAREVIQNEACGIDDKIRRRFEDGSRTWRGERDAKDAVWPDATKTFEV